MSLVELGAWVTTSDSSHTVTEVPLPQPPLVPQPQLPGCMAGLVSSYEGVCAQGVSHSHSVFECVLHGMRNNQVTVASDRFFLWRQWAVGISCSLGVSTPRAGLGRGVARGEPSEHHSSEECHL